MHLKHASQTGSSLCATPPTRTLPQAVYSEYCRDAVIMLVTLLAGLITQATGYAPLVGLQLPRVSTGEYVDLGSAISQPGTNLCVFGTYPADFNMSAPLLGSNPVREPARAQALKITLPCPLSILVTAVEYMQKLAFYLPAMQDCGIDRVYCTVNGAPEACNLIADLVGLPYEVDLLSDVEGVAGRVFGVGRGWLPDEDLSPYLKLLGMLVGLGARDTLPSVITGYLGNPNGVNGWIQSAIAEGQRQGRWPDMALDVDYDSGTILKNEFDDLPVVGKWGRRPLELATLRLQTMLGISLAKWSELQPLDDRCLTQLGGLVVVRDGEVIYDWKDNGICNVAHFEDVLKAVSKNSGPGYSRNRFDRG